ncbi:hypothetical protein EDD17DRAFT_411329 [Pisolithus thermaeus]|nr:hypothetical protein EDD17DRAFT_411329 [Pisolithus thermaeus]
MLHTGEFHQPCVINTIPSARAVEPQTSGLEADALICPSTLLGDMNQTSSGIPRSILLLHAQPERHIRPLKPVFFVSAIASYISVLNLISDLETVTPWFPANRRRLPARRLAQMRRWFVVKAAADVVLAGAAILGAFVSKRGATGEVLLSYRQGMAYTALRLVLSPQVNDLSTMANRADISTQILHCVADVCCGRSDTEHVAYGDLNLLTFRFWAIDIPALYCFLRAIKHARA